MTAELVAMASQFGTPGLLIVYVVWDRLQQNKRDDKRDDKDDKRDDRRLAADIQMAQALTLLTERVNHVR